MITIIKNLPYAMAFGISFLWRYTITSYFSLRFFFIPTHSHFYPSSFHRPINNEFLIPYRLCKIHPFSNVIMTWKSRSRFSKGYARGVLSRHVVRRRDERNITKRLFSLKVPTSFSLSLSLSLGRNKWTEASQCVAVTPVA